MKGHFFHQPQRMAIWLVMAAVLASIIWFGLKGQDTQPLENNNSLNTVKKAQVPVQKSDIETTEFIREQQQAQTETKKDNQKTDTAEKNIEVSKTNKPLPDALAKKVVSQPDTRLNELSSDEQASLIKVSVNHRVNQWRSAWENGDAAQYLSFYSEQFKPADDISLSEWRKQRTQRVTPEKQIHLLLSNFEFELLDNNKNARVAFDQLYRAKGISDQSRKELLLTLEQGQWRIVSEQEL